LLSWAFDQNAAVDLTTQFQKGATPLQLLGRPNRPQNWFEGSSKLLYFAAFCFAHLLRCAAAIFSRDSALIKRFLWTGRPAGRVPLLVPASRARTWLRREISPSIWESNSVVFMGNSVAQGVV
jgi:hypothetical protein